MPNAYPREFRDDVVAVAQRRESGVTIKQIAEDFGISETCLQNWLRKAEIEAGSRPGATAAESAELRDLRKRNRSWSRKTRCCAAQLPTFRRRTCREKVLPARE